MPKVLIFEPPQSCSSGACGDEEAAGAFASLLDSLRARGAEVVRFDLGYQPEAFFRNAVVKETLSREGIACLPMTIVDEALIARGFYPTRETFEAILGRVPPPTASTDRG